MPILNRVYLAGTIISRPTLLYHEHLDALVHFRLRFEHWVRKRREWERNYVHIMVVTPSTEDIAEHMKPGKHIFVEGSLRYHGRGLFVMCRLDQLRYLDPPPNKYSYLYENKRAQRKEAARRKEAERAQQKHSTDG